MPEKAPFFLPSIPSLSRDIVFKPSDRVGEGETVETDDLRLVDGRNISSSSKFLQLLQMSSEEKNCE